jgi:hypothetical protein
MDLLHGLNALDKGELECEAEGQEEESEGRG